MTTRQTGRLTVGRNITWLDLKWSQVTSPLLCNGSIKKVPAALDSTQQYRYYWKWRFLRGLYQSCITRILPESSRWLVVNTETVYQNQRTCAEWISDNSVNICYISVVYVRNSSVKISRTEMVSVIKKLMRIQEYGEAYDENITSRLRKRKVSRRHVPFGDGMEEFSSDEDSDMSAQVSTELGPSALLWWSWIWYLAANTGRTSLEICYSLGKCLRWLFGISSPEYQYQINEERRIIAEEVRQRKRNKFCLYNYTCGNLIRNSESTHPKTGHRQYTGFPQYTYTLWF
jgi:hypothetical protein